MKPNNPIDDGLRTPVSVLLIEDDLVDEMALVKAVTDNGLPYKLMFARSVAEAREVLAANRFDVILSDYSLPDGTSFDLLDEFADQVVIFTTGEGDEETAAKALHLGIQDYLIKDPQRNYLKLLPHRVETVLRQTRMDRQLRESEARYRAVTHSANDAIITADSAGNIVDWNRGAESSFGYTQEEICGQPLTALMPQRYREPHLAGMCRLLSNGSLRAPGKTVEIIGLRKDEREFPLELSLAHWENAGCLFVTAIIRDITVRKAAEEEIHQLAFFDSLTRLPNRRLLRDRLHQAQSTNARSGKYGALLFVDLDNFKAINDTLGHDKGDLLLQQVAKRLPSCVRESDTVARIGGDEFVLMLSNLSEASDDAAAQAEAVGEKILVNLNQPYLLAGHVYHSSPSIGITLFSNHRETVAELLKRADLAMYQAKAAGRNTLRFFDSAMQSAVTVRAAMNADLRQGLEEDQFLLHYQIQVDGEGRTTGAEALIRWRHPLRGMVSPAEFIPLAEESGVILALGQWVLEIGCRQLVTWAVDPSTAHLTLAVNVSARQLYHPDFVSQVLAVLEATGADPNKLKLELTESLLLHDVEDIIAKMTELQDRGVGFSLDDFGTGYSSLSYLKRLPLDQLKIDQSFVRDVLSDPNDAAIARAIITLAQSLGLAVIAEGVETEEQRDFLASEGCHAFQGYLFGRPGPAATLF